MQNRESFLKKEIVRIGKLLYDRSLIVATDGNISVRLRKNLILITPAGYCKGKLKSSEIIQMSLKGEPIRLTSKLKPSSEYQLHFELYNKCDDINAIIHVHPVYATVLASAKEKVKIKALDWLNNLPEFSQTVGGISNVSYYPAGSKVLAEAVAKKMIAAKAALLANHGVVVSGADLSQAQHRIERIEFGAKLYLLSILLNKFSG